MDGEKAYGVGVVVVNDTGEVIGGLILLGSLIYTSMRVCKGIGKVLTKSDRVSNASSAFWDTLFSRKAA
jgi:hypothetical protein